MPRDACPGLPTVQIQGILGTVSARAIVVLVAGDPVPETRLRRGGFLDLIQGSLVAGGAPGFPAEPWLAHDLRELDVLPDLTDASSVIVTGSPASVMDGLPWMERSAACLRQLVLAEVPVLGICFGHQLLAHALGGRVSANPRGREMGTVDLTISHADPVVGELGTLQVNSTHVDSVVELPPGAQLLGATALDPHAAVRFGPSAWGVQFHPEIDAEVMRHYLAARRSALLTERFDVAALERGVRDAPGGAAMIGRFLQVARGKLR